jgi:Pentapeptide repeats (8 copies)
MSGASPGPPATTMTPLEQRHLRSQIRAAWAQVVGVLLSAAAVSVAIVVALLTRETVEHNSQTTLQQSEDSQLSTAITALGSENSAERIAGLILLERNASGRISLSSKTGEPAGDVFDNYQTALRVYSGYLSSQSQDFLSAAARASVPFVRGHGTLSPPGLPLDIVYAADQVKFMLELSSKVTALDSGQPVIDLSNDELIGQPWNGVDFSWIDAYMPGIDLRGADLESSHWGKDSNLQYSYLQCTDLKGAVFGRADLSHAYLDGANVQGADFRYANLQGIHGTNVYGNAKWSRLPPGMKILPLRDWDPTNLDTCLRENGLPDRKTDNQLFSTCRPDLVPGFA